MTASATTTDEQAVWDLLQRYGSRLDDQDSAGILGCFTDDVCLEYFNGAVVSNGIESAGQFFRFDGSRSGLPGLDEILHTTHLWNLQRITVDGDSAQTEVACIAHLLGRSGPDFILVTRGLRYVDDHRRTADGWRIAHRRHQPKWESRAPATTP